MAKTLHRLPDGQYAQYWRPFEFAPYPFPGQRAEFQGALFLPPEVKGFVDSVFDEFWDVKSWTAETDEWKEAHQGYLKRRLEVAKDLRGNAGPGAIEFQRKHRSMFSPSWNCQMLVLSLSAERLAGSITYLEGLLLPSSPDDDTVTTQLTQEPSRLDSTNVDSGSREPTTVEPAVSISHPTNAGYSTQKKVQ